MPQPCCRAHLLALLPACGLRGPHAPRARTACRPAASPIASSGRVGGSAGPPEPESSAPSFIVGSGAAAAAAAAYAAPPPPQQMYAPVSYPGSFAPPVGGIPHQPMHCMQPTPAQQQAQQQTQLMQLLMRQQGTAHLPAGVGLGMQQQQQPYAMPAAALGAQVRLAGVHWLGRAACERAVQGGRRAVERLSDGGRLAVGGVPARARRLLPPPPPCAGRAVGQAAGGGSALRPVSAVCRPPAAAAAGPHPAQQQPAHHDCAVRAAGECETSGRRSRLGGYFGRCCACAGLCCCCRRPELPERLLLTLAPRARSPSAFLPPSQAGVPAAALQQQMAAQQAAAQQAAAMRVGVDKGRNVDLDHTFEAEDTTAKDHADEARGRWLAGCWLLGAALLRCGGVQAGWLGGRRQRARASASRRAADSLTPTPSPAFLCPAREQVMRRCEEVTRMLRKTLGKGTDGDRCVGGARVGVMCVGTERRSQSCPAIQHRAHRSPPTPQTEPPAGAGLARRTRAAATTSRWSRAA